QRRCIIRAMLCTVLAAALTFTAPQGWHASKPSSSMRVAEFTLPRADGDSDDAQLVLYYFGGQGGSVDANIDRWVGQMRVQQPTDTPKKERRTVNGLTVNLVDVNGTYIAEMAPGSDQRHNQPHFRLRADVTRVDVAKRADIGASGYEKIAGTVHFAVDPNDPRNAVIADLDIAPRNAAGLVEFSADMYVLRPKDAAHSNGSALVEVSNRG